MKENDIKTIPQGSLLWPRETFQFKNGKATVTMSPGQSVWVTNSGIDQNNTGIIKLARSGKGSGYAWNFTASDVKKYFTN